MASGILHVVLFSARISKREFICIQDHISGYDMEHGVLDPADVDGMERKVRTFITGIIEDLKELISVPSVAFPDYPPEPVLRMAALHRGLPETVRAVQCPAAGNPRGLSCRSWYYPGSSGSANGAFVCPL